MKSKSGKQRTEDRGRKTEDRRRSRSGPPHRGMATEDRKGESRKTEGGIVLPPEERFFTKPELAKVMKVSVRCVTDMMRRGEIRYLKINGHLVRFRLQDVNQRLSETVLFCGMPALGEPGPRREDGGPKTGKLENAKTRSQAVTEVFPHGQCAPPN